MHGGKSLDQMHDQWLGSLSQSLDSFMRTPPFLDMLKQTLKRMIDLKVLQDQMAQSVVQQTGVAQGAEPASVYDQVRSVEQTILTRLAALEDRLKALEERLPTSPSQQERD
jgi:hypothetical protein